MKATDLQIDKLNCLLDGAEKNDSPLNAHIDALTELTDYFIENLLDKDKEEYADIACYIVLPGFLKRDLNDFLKN